MDGPRMARLLPSRLAGGLASAGAVGVFGLMALASAMPALACCFTVSTLQYTGTTQTSLAAPGLSIYDTAQIQVTPNQAVPSGTVSFSLYSGSICSGTPVFQSLVAYSGTGTSPSPWINSADYTLPTNISAPATYEWNVSYTETATGGTGITAWSGCGQEPVQVSQATVTTVPSAATGPVGAPLSDTAQVVGITSPVSSDTVTFSLYLASATAPTSCAAGTLVEDFGASPLVGSASPWTATSNGSYAPTVAGTYLWQAQFNAVNDPNNLSSQVFCGEAVTIGTGGQLAASTGSGQLAASTAPDTGFGGGGLTLLGAVAVILGGLAVCIGVRLRRATA
jgi:hypothetical protein